MKKFNSNKSIIITLIIVIAVVFLVSFSALRRDEGKEANAGQSFVNDTVGMLDKGISYPIKALEGGFRSVGTLFNTYDENERLKKRLDEFASLDSEYQNLKKENEQLKEQLQLNDTLSNYEKISASVINRSPDTWQDILIIDRGKKDEVEVNMPVLGSKGVIGRVMEANPTSAKVELLTSSNQNSNHFPVMVTPQEGEIAYGLMENYNEQEGAFIVTQLTTIDGLQEGDQVTTSGLGGESPRGLVIGSVKKIKANKFGLDKEVYVTPASSLYDVSAVTVVKRLAGSEN